MYVYVIRVASGFAAQILPTVAVVELGISPTGIHVLYLRPNITDTYFLWRTLMFLLTGSCVLKYYYLRFCLIFE